MPRRTGQQRPALAIGDEQVEAAQRRQPAVAGGDAAVALVLDVVEKAEDLATGEISEIELRDVPPASRGHEAQEQPPRVPVRVDRVR
jgi:hypothetical protein